MRNHYLLYIFILLTMAVLPACDEIFNVDVIGDGNRLRETRYLNGFQSLYLESDFEVNLRSGDDFLVEVEADSNLLQYVETEVEAGELILSVSSNFNVQPRHPVRVYLEVPERFTEVEVINGGHVKADSLSLDELNVALYGVSQFAGERINCPVNVLAEGSTTTRLSGTFKSLYLRQRGSGNMTLEGQSDVADVLLEGSGKIDAKALAITDGDIRLYGSGLILCDVSDFLQARVDGSGRIYYYSKPQNIEKELEGEGMIVPGKD